MELIGYSNGKAICLTKCSLYYLLICLEFLKLLAYSDIIRLENR